MVTPTVNPAARSADVSPFAYYAARDGRPSDRGRQYAELATRIAAEHKRSKGRYGAPRIHAGLRRQGRCHSGARVARLMRQAGRAPEAVKEDHHP